MKKVILIILDGWGLGKPDKFNAIDNAKKPNFTYFERNYPNIRLRADGMYVGLPDDQFGTSEINHQVIGAGRVILQDLPKINKVIHAGELKNNVKIKDLYEHVNKNNSKLHIAGIISDGKVHASLEHILDLIKTAREAGIKKLYIHAFTDGRDVPPQSAEKYLKRLDEALLGFEKSSISTVQGRFWLDRDRDWEKTETALKLMVDGDGQNFKDWRAVVNFNYNQGKTDEYFDQYLLDAEGLIQENDAVIFPHYRTDRTYQIIKKLEEKRVKNLQIASFTEVSEEFEIPIIFPREKINHTLAETIAKAGKSQFHITETEKYRHLTYFFNGSREVEFPKEHWNLIQSNRFVKPFYNFEPSMQAFAITNEVISQIKAKKADFIVVNYPNTDMVGHTGNYEAAVIAAESVDYCIGKVYKEIENNLEEYALIITADHGNSDEMWDYENNQPHTQHTTNPVPFILISDIQCRLDARESLEDIAPTILDLMDIAKPEEMSGNSLIIRQQ